MVIITDPTSPPSARIGVALMSVLTLRPAGTASTTSSARTVSPMPSVCSKEHLGQRHLPPVGAADRDHLQELLDGAVRASAGLSTMRRASRLNETGRPARALRTTTPTGEVSTRASREVSTRASRSARVHRSRRWVRGRGL